MILGEAKIVYFLGFIKSRGSSAFRDLLFAGVPELNSINRKIYVCTE
jgi:hypothetical protein